MRKLAFALILLLAPALAQALAAPTGLAGGTVASNSTTLDWNEDTAVNQWNIYLGGVLRYQPFRSDTSVPSTGRRRFLMTNLPSQTSIVVTMRALAPGQPISAESAAITITSSTVPVTYVQSPPGQPLVVSGSFSPATGSAATAVSATVTSDISASSAARNASLASIDAKASLAATEATLVAMNARIAVMEGHLTSTAKGTVADPTVADATVIGGTIGVTQSGTWTNQVVGNVASGSPDSGNPVKTGGQVMSSSSHTSASDFDRIDAHFDKQGSQLTAGSPRENRVKGYASIPNTTETTVLAAGAAGIFHDLVTVVIINSGNNTNIASFRDVTGGAVDFKVPMASGGGGAVITFAHNPWPQDTAANNWTVELANTPAGGGTVEVFILAKVDK